MTTLGKVLTVVLTIASVLFAATSLAVYFGGPNWPGRADQVEGYSFTRTGGEVPQWKAIDNSDGSTVKTAAMLPDVIPAALDKKVQKMNAELTELKTQREQLTQRLAFSKQTADADAVLLQQRITELQTRIQEVAAQTTAAAGQLAAANDQVARVESDIADRRGDVFRLQTVLEQAELDGERATRIRRQLADLIVQLEADLSAARARLGQVRSALGESGSATMTGEPGGETATRTASAGSTSSSSDAASNSGEPR